MFSDEELEGNQEESPPVIDSNFGKSKISDQSNMWKVEPSTIYSGLEKANLPWLDSAFHDPPVIKSSLSGGGTRKRSVSGKAD